MVQVLHGCSRMSGSHLIIYDEDYRKINACLSRLHEEARGKAVFLIDKNGQLIASCGETSKLDTTSLASLAAGNMAATGGLAQILGEREFSIIFHEGERDNLHISLVAHQVILVVLFDRRSSLGLVRLRVKKASDELSQIFDALSKRGEEAQRRQALFQTPFSELTDDDIENLFSR